MKIHIIGAGINGLMSAKLFSQAGYTVSVYERRNPGAGASWAGAGMLAPVYPWQYPSIVTEMSEAGRRYYQDWFADSPDNVAYQSTASLILDDIPQNPQFPVLTREAISTFQTGLDAAKAALNVNCHSLRNPRLIKYLVAELAGQGVDIQCGQAVDAAGLAQQGERVVVTTGAYTAKQFSELPIQPVRGQLMLLQAPKGFRLNTIVVKAGGYLVPRGEQQILVGTTSELVGFDEIPTEKAYRRLFDWAAGIFPQLAEAQVLLQWTGLRPGSPKGIPLIDRHPEIENLYFNIGQFRNGLAMAPSSAQTLLARVSGQSLVAQPWLDSTSWQSFTA